MYTVFVDHNVIVRSIPINQSDHLIYTTYAEQFYVYPPWGFPGGLDGKASACNAGDLGSIPGSGRSLEKEMAIYSSTLAWKIPWMEEPDRLQSMGCKELDTSEGISLEGMMLKLKLQYLGHLM